MLPATAASPQPEGGASIRRARAPQQATREGLWSRCGPATYPQERPRLCGNGAVGASIKRLTQALPGRHFLLNDKGLRWLSVPITPIRLIAALNLMEPRLCRWVLKSGPISVSHLTLMVIVWVWWDETGRMVWPDQVLLFSPVRLCCMIPRGGHRG